MRNCRWHKRSYPKYGCAYVVRTVILLFVFYLHKKIIQHHFHFSWNNNSTALLHFEEIVFQNLRSLLESRISSANRCVIYMYLDEYQVLGHLKNLQKVYFMEAGDLMFLFYSNLFKQVSKYLYFISIKRRSGIVKLHWFWQHICFRKKMYYNLKRT